MSDDQKAAFTIDNQKQLYFIEFYKNIIYSNCNGLNWRDLDHRIRINNKKETTVNFPSLYRTIQNSNSTFKIAVQYSLPSAKP